jgi:acyl dehydratase
MSALLDEINNYIDIESEPIKYVIDAGSIKLFADSIMDPDRLYCDEEYAKTTVHGGIIAPPTFFGGATGLRRLKAGDSRTMSSFNLPIPKGWTSVAAGDEFQFFPPVKPGDTLTCREKMIGAYEKQSHSGTLIFVTREKTFTNQNNRIVLIRKLSSVCIERLNRDTTSREENPTKDVNSKTELPELTIGPVTIRHLAMFAVATAEFVDIHYDQAYARSLGLPDVIIQGLYKTTIIAQMLKNWAGNGNAIRWLSVQHRGMDVAENTLKAGGRVIETSKQKDGTLTKCEVWIDNQHGQRTSIGTAGLIVPYGNV